MDLQKISAAIENLVNLDVRTVIGSCSEVNGKLQPDQGARMMQTRINLLDGDITTVINEDFLNPPLDEIRAFHSQRERQSQEMIYGNIQALKELSALAVSLTNQQRQQASLDSNVTNLRNNG